MLSGVSSPYRGCVPGRYGAPAPSQCLECSGSELIRPGRFMGPIVGRPALRYGTHAIS